MKEITFVHTADLHIGAQCGYLGTLAQRRRSEVLITFRRIADYCLNEEIGLLVIAGDLFDSNNIDAYFVDDVFETFGRIPDTRIIFAAGNHDPLTADSPFLNRELPANLTVLPTHDSVITLEDMGVRIYGRSFGSVYEDKINYFEQKPQDDDLINIMVLHGDSENTSGAYRSIPSQFIEDSGMDYIALGHIHAASPLKRLGKTYFAYCGCPDGQGFDEAGQKGFYRITLKGGKADAQFVPCSSRQHIICEPDVTGTTSNAAISALVLSQLRNNYGDTFADNIYKIVLRGTVSQDFTVNVGEIAADIGANVFFAKVKSNVKHQADLEALSREQTLKGIFVKKMLEKINKAPEDERNTLENAIQLALAAFEGEVSSLED